MDDIFDYIRTQKSEYETTTIPLIDGDEYSQYQTLRQVNLYWRNQYLESAYDNIIGQYPFDNISKFRVLLEARATDFDTKHIEVEPEKPDRVHRVKAMIASKALRQHMRDIKFGAFINDLCMTRPKYGGVLAKKTEDGVFVSKWENLITDQSDVMAGLRIERHYMLPSELTKKKGSWKNVKEAIQTADEYRDKDVGADNMGDVAQTQGDLIEVFEIQGEVQKSMLVKSQAIMMHDDLETLDYNEDDDYEYVEATIIAVGADWIDKKKDPETDEEYDECDGLVMYAEQQTTTQKYLARNPITGRGLGEGVVESLFEHQKWHNFSKTEEVRMVAIAGKKLYVTDDPDVTSNVYDDGVDHGTILKVKKGNILKELNQIPTGTPLYQGMRQEWDQSADRVSSSFNAKIGEEAKSGTPFRAQYLQNIEASSQFEQYREEIGFFLQDIVTDWLLPDALKKLTEKDEIYSSFSPSELMLIDEVIIADEVNKRFIDGTLQGVVFNPEMLQQLSDAVKSGLSKQGTKRHIEQIKDFIVDAGGSVIVHTTDEARNKAVYFESLSNLLALLAPDDPRRNALIDRIMDALGITKEELELYMNEDVAPPQRAGNTPQVSTREMAAAAKSPAEAALMNVK